MSRTLAVIPARAGSKRLPNKNHRLFLGKPLILWTVDFALAYAGFDLVMVSTDSPEVSEIARNAGAYVPWLRPAELASDTATSVDVVLHAVDQISAEGLVFDRVALLQPTSPIRHAKRWNEARRLMDLGAIAALGVHEAKSHPYWTYLMDDHGSLSPCFPNGLNMRGQDLPMACVPNGALYLCEIDALREYRTFAPSGSRGVICTDPVESIDIDTASDWSLAERLVKELKNEKY